MPLLVTCCPLLGEQELTLTPRQRGGAAFCGCPSCTPSWRPHLLLSRASHATIQQPGVAATGVQDNVTKSWRPAEIKPSWSPPSTSARTLVNTASRARIGQPSQVEMNGPDMMKPPVFLLLRSHYLHWMSHVLWDSCEEFLGLGPVSAHTEKYKKLNLDHLFPHFNLSFAQERKCSISFRLI